MPVESTRDMLQHLHDDLLALRGLLLLPSSYKPAMLTGIGVHMCSMWETGLC